MKHFLLITLLVSTCAVSALAQATAGMGGLNGVVRDASGAVIPGAQVIVSNESKGIRRVLQSNEAGAFNAPALVPASGYGVHVTRDGFAPFEAKNIEILVGQNLTINSTLQVATTSSTVEVVDATPIVEQTKTEVSQVVESAQIQDLPINGRRVDTFVLLTPAVVADGTYGLVSFRGIAGGNSFLTDGNDTTNQYYNENAGRTRISSQISQDAVQEFQVLSNAYSAEHGRASGGVINTVTRSGSNSTHGTGYWFFRNQELNARDRYAFIKPDETRHQGGASVGGKIIDNKLFYFFNTDITRRNFPLVASNTYSPLFDSNGDVIATCTKATASQCDAARGFLARNKTTIPRESNQELLFGKLDWRPTDMHAISASFNYLRWIAPNGIQTAVALTNGGGLGSNGDSTVRTRYGRLSWTGILKSNVVNEARFGWFKDRLYDEFNASQVPVTGFATITVAGVSNLGMANYLPRLNPSENRYQFADNLTWTTGRHTVKFGLDIVNTRDYSNSLYNQWGTYSYSTFDAFALDFSGNTAGAKNWTTFSQ
ncbi:MAG TPA: carboxypeptidase regulatory-like domain-containing protein, partial [Bryobacteraceae bacterium]|nr:carboxypeptidase regulatory-like domain-containing protein [Bryobacteraceae bacterium]